MIYWLFIQSFYLLDYKILIRRNCHNVETPCELAGDLGWINTLYGDARGVFHLHGLTNVRVWFIDCLLISIFFSWKLKVRCLGGSDKLWNLKEKQTLTPLKPGYWNCKINLENCKINLENCKINLENQQRNQSMQQI